ncbi:MULTISPECIES: DNA-3-methyladenine glycosylase [unclassified Kitasatospora]|uniref:DNA-3-methyladenine glycosylase family protein n=1 Tax=unclassified Kitasatospora TaxID=2633591 RepID=UPI00070C3FFA|nr:MULTISPECIES: DNA-3-methyladenine glycosylase [unclassified Kitasatospora]KQV16575.1 Fe-S cluster assembly protein HesB [Kitasatospora sp. Root107]KRB71602.1 Fe-S cluster assembly protein HesB [Kitasatospora sp. Root187]
MTAVAITPRGPFSLAASMHFLEGFTPAGYTSDGRVLRLAFPSDDGRSTVSASVWQANDPEGTVLADVTVHTGNPGEERMGPAAAESNGGSAVRAQMARILSLDVDGSGFPRLAEDDPVLAELIAAYPGLRPVCFYSPYEAAAWAVIGHRIRMVQAAAIKARISEHHGQRVTVAGESLHAFPTPLVLRGLSGFPGLPETKVERLRLLADAALAGDLDAAGLRAMPVEDALAHLRTLPGIGPFSAELILIRGAGHPDTFPRHERRLHASMADAYGLGDPAASDARRLAGISDRWAPYRSWAALLLRTRWEEMSRAASRGRSVR